MKLGLSMLFRPFDLAIVVALAALIVLCGLTPKWYSMVKSIETQVNLNAQNFVSQLMSEIERSSELVQPLNLTPTNLSRFINSNLNLRSTTNIETQVAPVLFEASMTLPFLTQITYIDTEDGRFFAYDLDHDVPQAIFNDVVSSPNYPNDPYQRLQTSYFGRSVDRDSGKLDGEAYPVNSITINETWFKHALNSPNGYSAVVEKWTSSDDLVFLSSARMEGTGLLCLGFAVDAITNFITAKSGSYGSSLYLATIDGTVLVQGLNDTQMMVVEGNQVSVQTMKSIDGDRQVSIRTVPCRNHDGASEPTILDIDNKEFMFYCSHMDTMGAQMVYALAFERAGLLSFVGSSRKAGLRLMTTTILLIIIFTANFVFITIRSIRIETHLSSRLTKQMEATEAAERTSTNKSIALASATHDIRASLAGLTGLIESSSDQVALDSAVATNLKLMDTCVNELHGLLNSILDTSKIEAGQMQLDEEEFDISQLVEDVVDLYHPVAMKKGVDVILDPCNGSLYKHFKVKGDRGKLRQILCNLLSNAVKFTDQGYIKVRAWSQKPSLQNSVDGIAASNEKYNFLKSLLLFWKNTDARKHGVEATQVPPNAMEFVFEVDDSGKGIPKDKRQSVFENYVQVKETAAGRQGGTGLGLGIVKSLVRLMHGDVTIVDKNMGEEGTCFKFNILLTTSTINEGNRIVEDEEGNQSSGSGQTISPTYRDPKPSPMSPRLSTVSGSSPQPERSHVILLIKDQERMTTCRRFMENMGIIVWTVETWEQLSLYLKNITKQLSHCALVGSSDTSRYDSSNEDSVIPDSPNSKPDCFPYSIFKKSNAMASPCCVLLVIDSNAGPMDGLAKIVTEFRRTIPNPFKLVWLEGTAHSRRSSYGCFDKETMDAEEDIIVSRAFHGRKLYEVAGVLPELGGVRWEKSLRQPEKACKEMPKPDDNDFSPIAKYWTGFLGPDNNEDLAPAVARDNKTDNRKFLSGMKVLVVEDSALLQKIAKALLEKLGAVVEQCTNGEEAVEKVSHELEKNKGGDSFVLPYHYILMDCVMPVMDGYEATVQIRAMEKEYGLHIPIIALTAHTSGSNAAIEALNTGMDSHLIKPLSDHKLWEAITSIMLNEK